MRKILFNFGLVLICNAVCNKFAGSMLIFQLQLFKLDLSRRIFLAFLNS